jgi:hypothetical protein
MSTPSKHRMARVSIAAPERGHVQQNAFHAEAEEATRRPGNVG